MPVMIITVTQADSLGAYCLGHHNPSLRPVPRGRRRAAQRMLIAATGPESLRLRACHGDSDRRTR
eukprot:3841456-Rhodomonas_salina.1